MGITASVVKAAVDTMISLHSTICGVMVVVACSAHSVGSVLVIVGSALVFGFALFGWLRG